MTTRVATWGCRLDFPPDVLTSVCRPRGASAFPSRGVSAASASRVSRSVRPCAHGCPGCLSVAPSQGMSLCVAPRGRAGSLCEAASQGMFEGSQNALHSGPHALPGLTAAGSLRASGPPPAVRRWQSQDAAPETVGGPRGAHLHGHLPGGLRCGVAPITGLTVQRGLRRASLAGGSPVQLGSPEALAALPRGSQLPFARSPAGGAVAHGKQSTWFACPRPASREGRGRQAGSAVTPDAFLSSHPFPALSSGSS